MIIETNKRGNVFSNSTQLTASLPLGKHFRLKSAIALLPRYIIYIYNIYLYKYDISSLVNGCSTSYTIMFNSPLPEMTMLEP